MLRLFKGIGILCSATPWNSRGQTLHFKAVLFITFCICFLSLMNCTFSHDFLVNYRVHKKDWKFTKSQCVSGENDQNDVKDMYLGVTPHRFLDASWLNYFQHWKIGLTWIDQYPVETVVTTSRALVTSQRRRPQNT